jgi:hypothetical protein
MKNKRQESQPAPSKDELEYLIAQLEQKRSELQSQLPAHSISPSLIIQLDELDEEIESLKSKLDT